MPVVLRERLRRVAALGRGEAHPRAERQLRLREMDEKLARGPLPRRVALFPGRRRPGVHEIADLIRSLAEGLERIAGTQVSGVGVGVLRHASMLNAKCQMPKRCLRLS